MGKGILVLCEHDGGAFKKTAFELLGKAKELASTLGGSVTALVIGEADGASLGAFGAAQTLQVRGEAIHGFNTGTYARALQAAIAAADPAVVLAAANPATKDFFPRVAARLNLGLATEATGLRTDGGKVIARRPMYAGKALADVSFNSATALVSVRPNSFPQPTPGAGQAAVTALAVTLAEGDLAAVVESREAASASEVDLTEADRIVSGGRSVKSREGFDSLIRPMAAAIGATAGASRAAVDAGYASHSAQVGQTGKVVNPTLYIACGISGAIQHLAGMRTSRIIVAINTDADAPIFQHATYGIVGDMFVVGPKLTAALRQAMS